MVNRVVVGAHYGLRDWLIQRISALVMIAYVLGLALFLSFGAPLTYDSWKTTLSHPFVKIFTLLFTSALLLHAWVGVRDIFMDYVHPYFVRLMLQVIVILLLMMYALWAATLLWSM